MVVAKSTRRWIVVHGYTSGSKSRPHTFESGFPRGWHQFASDGASSRATMALLFTLPDKPPPITASR